MRNPKTETGREWPWGREHHGDNCADSEPEPDLAVVAGRKEDFRHDHPRTAEFVIEVCVTSHDYDRSKLRAYAAAGVKECWFVLGPEKQIEVYRPPKDAQFATHAKGRAGRSPALHCPNSR